MDTLIEVNGLNKTYKIYDKPYYRLAEWISGGNMKKHREFRALQDISFSVSRGECIGIVGHNGAGKSTLLKILSHALWPTSGTVDINGNMVSLLELGTGFHPELTGIQNIFNSGKLLGFTEDYLHNKLDAIIDFAELGDFIHQPVKTYSSGMYVRLAFSLYANLEPDIYVVDEALSVGDIFFQQKCFDFLHRLKESGTGILLVTHDMQTVKKYCDRVLILSEGRIVDQGDPLEMVNLFYTMNRKNGVINDTNGSSYLVGNDDPGPIEIPIASRLNIEHAAGIRRGNGQLKILGAIIVDADNNEIRTANTGDSISIHIYAELLDDISDLTYTFQISDRHSTVVFGQNSYMIDKNRLVGKKGQIMKASFDIEMNLFQGLYTVMVGASDCQTEVGNIIYDWVEGCMTLEILRPQWRTFHGVAYMNSTFKIEGGSMKEVIMNG